MVTKHDSHAAHESHVEVVHEEHHGSIRPFQASVGLGITTLGLTLAIAPPAGWNYVPGSGIFLFGLFIFGWGFVGWLKDDFPTGVDHDPPTVNAPFRKTEIRKLGVWIFLLTEMMIFSSLLSTYLKYRTQIVDWKPALVHLDITLGALNTFALLTSSLTFVVGLYGVRTDNRRLAVLGMLGTLFLGTVFLFIKAFEWVEMFHAGFTPWSGLEGSTFYIATGTHGAHVFGGLLGLVYLSLKCQKGLFNSKNWEPVEYFGLYWHFIDIVWVFLFPLFYLL